MSSPAADTRRRWLYLAVGVLAQTSSSIFQFGMPFLLPQLQEMVGGSLVQAAFLAACPNLGLMATLIAWGWVADRRGERITMAVGLTLGGLLLLAAPLTTSPVSLGILLFCAGAASASVNAASGRMIMGWFAARERGLAMGIRQTAQPLGVAIAAGVLPLLAESRTVQEALLVSAALCISVGVITYVVVANPPSRQQADQGEEHSPYRHSLIWRIHAASALLIVPQFTVSAFAFLYLIDGQHLTPVAAGSLLSLTQLIGAGARIAVGIWSDRVGSRYGPLRALALAGAVSIGVFAAAAALGSPLAVPALLLASVVTVGNNGLSFTAVAEVAGSTWSGRALGAQNTIQNVVATATPTTLAAIITAVGFAGGFASVLVFPLAAVWVSPPRRAEESARRRSPEAGARPPVPRSN